MRYIDMHCDTLGSALAQKKETFLELDDTMVDGLRLQARSFLRCFCRREMIRTGSAYRRCRRRRNS